ncbi:MAG TPA: ArsR family transcriptional regulator [Halococcus sp.]|nr:ArsR family transcriptional regulator [Halococcus sp.]
MSERTIFDCEDCLAPAEAFSVVANDSRLAILEALWRAPQSPVSFSELRQQVGMKDSAQFNYHLGRLTGQFVRKVEGGYEFRHAGEKVVRAVLEGSFNENPELAPFDIEAECVACTGPLQAHYTDERLTIECSRCGKRHGRYPFPPGGLNDRTRMEVVAAFDQRVRHLHCLAADGVCPECGGRMSTELTRDEWLGTDLCVIHRCAQCRHALRSTVGLSLLDHSDVVAFHREHGVSLCETPYWEFAWCVDDEYTSIRSTEPWEIEVTIPLGGERLSLTLDGDLTVTGIERTAHEHRSETAGETRSQKTLSQN